MLVYAHWQTKTNQLNRTNKNNNSNPPLSNWKRFQLAAVSQHIFHKHHKPAELQSSSIFVILLVSRCFLWAVCYIVTVPVCLCKLSTNTTFPTAKLEMQLHAPANITRTHCLIVRGRRSWKKCGLLQFCTLCSLRWGHSQAPHYTSPQHRWTGNFHKKNGKWFQTGSQRKDLRLNWWHNYTYDAR